MFILDQPIQSSTQDIIGRKHFAHSVAETIFTYKTENELVLGLYGEWGSGKTSLLNLIVERIEELSGNEKNKPIIIKFNPWNFSEQNQLISQYFSIFSGILRRKDNSKELLYIGDKLEEYSNIFEPLSIIPILGKFTFLPKILMKLSGASIKLKVKKNADLDGTRKELNDLLKKNESKFIVIIDDIDRLTPSEIRQVFQLVKKIADFPNTIYILSFDKKIVLNALQEVHNGFENEYLEKIIQVPFEIPPITKEDMYQYLFKQLEKIIVELPKKDFDEGYWGNIFHSGIKYYFSSLRDVSRYTNVLAFNYSLVRGEVNVIDFFAITAIQVFHADLFYMIRSNKEYFAGYKDSQSIKYFSDDKEEKKFYNALIPQNKKIPRDKLEDFLSRLFPKLESIFGHSFYGAGWSGEWRKKCRICSEECFDRYFKLVINDSELSQHEMESILSTANNYNQFNDLIIKLNYENRIIKFLELLEDYTSDNEIIPLGNIQNIISCLMDLGDLFPEKENRSIYEYDTPIIILQVFYQLSRRFDNHDSRFQLFKTAIEKATNSIYTIVHEVGVQDQQHGINTKESKMPRDKLTVKPEQLEILHDIAVYKIEEWSKKIELIHHIHFGAILYRWKEWKGIETVKRYIEEIIENDIGLVNFVRAFLIRTVSHGIGDYTGKVSWKINLKDIEEFIELKNIEKRIRKLSDSELNEYSEIEKIAILTFLEYYDGKRNIYE